MNITPAAINERLAALHVSAKAAMADLTQEQLDWAPGFEMSSLAVLAAHIIGVERYYLGVLAGGRAEGRDRPAEFATSGVSYAALCQRLDDSYAWCAAVVDGLTDTDMTRMSWWASQSRDVSGEWAVLQGLTHVAEHVGHMQITRDLIMGKTA